MSTTVTNTIAANLAALVSTLGRARETALHAADAICTGNRNLAIGALLDLEQLLPQADALIAAIMALHRGDKSCD
jgi:hypothetical protein